MRGKRMLILRFLKRYHGGGNNIPLHLLKETRTTVFPKKMTSISSVVTNPTKQDGYNDNFFALLSSQDAVGTPVAGRPPHRSVLAELPHTAPTSSTWRQNGCLGTDEQRAGAAANGPEAEGTVPMSSDIWLSVKQSKARDSCRCSLLRIAFT